MSKGLTPTEARSLLVKVQLDLEKSTIKGLEKALLFAEGEAKSLCPVDEGTLRMAMASEVEERDSELVGVLYNTMEYAVYVHQGTGIYAENGEGRKTPWTWYGESGKWEGRNVTVGQKPTPFMRLAIENNMKHITDIIVAEGAIK